MEQVIRGKAGLRRAVTPDGIDAEGRNGRSRLVLLGCAASGIRTQPLMCRIRSTELVAVCDLVKERAEAGGAKHGVPAYGSLKGRCWRPTRRSTSSA